MLNSDLITQRVRPLQARGEHNPRDFDKYVWQLPIPLYDATNARHRRLSALAEQAELVAGGVELPTGLRFETWRRRVRDAIAATSVGAAIEADVAGLLGG